MDSEMSGEGTKGKVSPLGILGLALAGVCFLLAAFSMFVLGSGLLVRLFLC